MTYRADGETTIYFFTMSLSAQYVTDLTRGGAYSFADWPNPNVPTFGAGV